MQTAPDPIYALNLFDLADNDDYRAYSRRSRQTVESYGGRVVALGRLREALESTEGVDPRQVLIVVEWPSPEAFDAFLENPELADLHPLRANGTERYLWWTFDKLPDLRPLFAGA